MQNFRRNLIVTIVIVPLYLAGSSGQAEDIVQAFSQFEWWLLPVCLGLSLLNYAIRFCKWHYYLRILNITDRVSFQIYMSGMVMAATPGKPEGLSPTCSKVSAALHQPARSIILAERLTDFIAFFPHSDGDHHAATGIYGFGISLVSSSFCTDQNGNGRGGIDWNHQQVSLINHGENYDGLRKYLPADCTLSRCFARSSACFPVF